MDAARDQLLAGAVLAEDQHAAVGRRRHRDLLAQLRHHVALADHREPPVDVRAQRPVLRLEPPLPDGVADDQHGLFERERLLDEVERAHLDRAHRRFDVAVARDHHDRRVDPPLAQPRQRREAVHPRQPDVEHDDVVGRSRDAGRDRPRRCRRRRPRSPRRAARRSSALRTPASSSTMRTVGFIDSFSACSFQLPVSGSFQ